MSEEQALFYFAEARYWVKDLAGTGAVLVNGNPARSGVALQSNDRITLSPKGPTFSFLGEGRLIEEDLSAMEGGGDASWEPRPEMKLTNKEPAKGKLSLANLKKLFRDN
jgi:pSer/pThr/pTyr-binding forkhead associated (FHA) protein